MDHDLDQEPMETLPNYYKRVMDEATGAKFSGDPTIAYMVDRLQTLELTAKTHHLPVLQDPYHAHVLGLEGGEDYSPFIFGERESLVQMMVMNSISRHVTFRVLTETFYNLVGLLKIRGCNIVEE